MKIFLTGCSWGCGEWEHIGSHAMSDKILHKGIEQYFNDIGYKVINVSKSGSGNKLSVDRLQVALEENFEFGDIVLFIQSDPIRDFRPGIEYDKPPVAKEVQKRLFAAGSLRKLNEELIEEQYQRLEELGKKHNTTIQLIGGLFNIQDTVTKYQHLDTLVKSWIHELIGHMPEYYYVKNSDFGIIQNSWNIDDTKLYEAPAGMAEKLLDEIWEFFRNDYLFREDIFHPDGLHPNRYGHKIIFDQIVEKLNLINAI